VVPHMSHMDSVIVKKLQQDSRFMVIDPMREPEIVVKELTSCKLILSSSLHGLVVADSFGIPNAHLEFAELEEGNFKFEDYFSGIGKEHTKYTSELLFDDEKLEKIIASYAPVHDLEQIQKGLISAFPYRDKVTPKTHAK